MDSRGFGSPDIIQKVPKMDSKYVFQIIKDKIKMEELLRSAGIIECGERVLEYETTQIGQG